jgi:hypothetical protein
MRRFAIVWGAAAGLLAAGFFLTGGSSRADVDKEMYDALHNIAKALQSGDKAAAQQQAKAYSKKIEELGDLMHAFKPRKNRGLGWGTRKGVVEPDAIEKKLDEIADKGITPAQMKKEAAALEEGSWMIAAIAEVTLAKGPEKVTAKGTRKNWDEYSNQTRDGAIEMAKTAKAGNAAAFQAVANKVNSACNNCHSKFKP